MSDDVPAVRGRNKLWIAAIAMLVAAIALIVVGVRTQGVARDAGAASRATDLDALVDYVPQETFAVIGLDLEQARRLPASGRLVDALLVRTGQDATISVAARSGGLDVRAAGQALVVAAIPAGPGVDPWPLVIIAGPLDEARVEAELTAGGGAAGIRDTEGVTIAMRDASVLIREDLLVIAPAAVLDRAIAASAGESAAEGGPLRDALHAGHGGAAGFIAVRMIDDLRAVTRGGGSDLAAAAWFAGSVHLAGGVTVTGVGAFPDEATAARMAAAAEHGKLVGANKLRASDPVAARVVERVVATASGATTRVTATLDAVEAEAVLAAIR